MNLNMKSDRIHAVLTATPLLLLLHLTPPWDSLHVNFRSQEEIALFFKQLCFPPLGNVSGAA